MRLPRTLSPLRESIGIKVPFSSIYLIFVIITSCHALVLCSINKNFNQKDSHASSSLDLSCEAEVRLMQFPESFPFDSIGLIFPDNYFHLRHISGENFVFARAFALHRFIAKFLVLETIAKFCPSHTPSSSAENL